MTVFTKKALSNELKELSKKRKISKISISELVESCGISRQTFYYHFTDIYDLVHWIYLTDFFPEPGEATTFEEWYDSFYSTLINLKNNKSFVENTFFSLDAKIISDYMLKVFYNTISLVLKSNDYLVDNNANSILKFVSYGCTGIFINWIEENFSKDIDRLLENFKTFIDHNCLLLKKD